MTSLFDDVAGHVVFIEGKKSPWDGATVRVEVDLLKPVRVGQVLEVAGWVWKRERKKVFVRGELRGAGGEVYAKMEGLSIQPVKLGGGECDSVSTRTWVETDEVIYDSGWLE